MAMCCFHTFCTIVLDKGAVLGKSEKWKMEKENINNLCEIKHIIYYTD